MMATAGSPGSSSFLPLLESIEDNAAEQSEQTDAYLTIANRLSGEEGRQFLPAVEKHFSRFGKATLAHITSPNTELSQAALQALGFCVYHSNVVSDMPETLAAEILSVLCSLVVKSTDKNTCTRALWVISKQNFPPDIVAKRVPPILGTLESVWTREDIQSVVMEHEAINVVIRLLDQVPAAMVEGAAQWAKFVIPLVVHSASKVRLRAAAAMEMGMPFLLEKQTEVAAVIEPMMSTKLVPELQKLFMTKNETNVLKLWPLFVKLLGKLLHKGGPFINSLLHLEELGFRSSSPSIKKIAFIAWKSLIDNFALNPDILCSSKRMKLLMQPLMSIHVRTESLLLTKVEVWWYLGVKLGPNLSSNFDQVSVPLLQYSIGSDHSSFSGTPSRAVSQNGAVMPGTTGFSSPANTSRKSLTSSVQSPSTFPSIQLLGLEMLLHFFLGPEVIASAAKNKVTLSLEPLNHPLLTGASSFTKHAAVLTSNIRDGFINIGKEAPESLLAVIWTNLVRFVNLTIESGSKKDRHGCEVLTLMLQALQSIVTSEDLPADKVLILFEATVKGIPDRVLGSASYQVGKMDVLNGTPALFLIHLLYNSSMLSGYIDDERFFQCLKTLVHCGLSGPTSPLAFGEAVLGAIGRSAGSVQNKDQLLKMWNVVVSLLTDTITQSNEVNQGDALEHNFSAVHSALLLPITHLLRGTPMQQANLKLMLSTWSKLYKVFARCSALVVTAEENICCEELCAKMTATIDGDNLTIPSTLNVVTNILQVMVECVDFSPYTPQFQQKLKSPHTPRNWMKKRNKVLGNLSTFQCLLVQCLEVYLEDVEAPCEATGLALISILSAVFTNLTLANIVKEALTSLIQPLMLFFKHASSEPSKFSSQLLGKLEKLLVEVLSCLQTRSALVYDDELLALLSPLLCVLFPHKNKQLRTSTAHFWNSTFANSVNLTYPSEIRPILSQVKQKTPIILPGFEVVSLPDELSGQYSSENSLLETKLSGMSVSSAGKWESKLGKAAELKDKLVSTKLDFGSPNPLFREVLEEEASIDFVFIPPETKERVLTEHQKEMKRTKRVDIPAMYNNLDASLDTTVFTHYTQSQEDSLDKLPPEQADNITEEASDKCPQENVENKEDTEALTKNTQDNASPTAVENMSENKDQDTKITESADFSKEDYAKSDDKVEDITMESKEGTSPNISGSSDLISGTPQKSNSRRQSFITLEKYAEGTLASPSSAFKFTGPLIKSSNSQEYLNTHETTPSLASQISIRPNSERLIKDPLESPLKPNDFSKRGGPVRLMERMPSDTMEEDIIPDTQTEVEQQESTEMASTVEKLKITNQDENSQHTVNDSQSSVTEASPEEPRRSGRYRVRPFLPGDDPVERDERYMLHKRRRSEEKTKPDSPKLGSVQSGPKTRSMQAEEYSSTLRTRAQKDKRESSQTNSQDRIRKKIKLFNNSEGCLDNLEPRRRRIRESSQTDSPSDSQSDHESQSKRRYRRRSNSSLETMEENGMKKNILADKVASLEPVQQTTEQKKDDKQKKVSQIVTTSTPANSESLVSEHIEQTVKDKLNTDSEMDSPSQSIRRSQEFELEKKINQVTHCHIVTSPTNESQDEKSSANNLANDLEVKDETIVCTVDNLTQEISQIITPPSTDGPSLRRSRRSKTLESAESEDNSENKDSSVRQTRSISQAALPAVSHAEGLIGGRTRRSKVEEVQSNPESSHSLDDAGSTESSQGRGRYSRRRSSQIQVTNVDSLECESSEHTETTPVPKKRGKKSRALLLSPFTIKSKEDTNNHIVESDFEKSEKADMEIIDAKTQALQGSESLQGTHNIEEKDKVLPAEAVEKTDTNESKELSVSPLKTEQRQYNSNEENNSLQECNTLSLKFAETLDSVGISHEQNQDMLLNGPSAVEILFPSCEATEKLQASETLEEKAEDVSESDVNVEVEQNDDSCKQEYPVVPLEDMEVNHSVSVEQDQIGCPNIIDDLSKEEKQLAAIKEGNSHNQDTPLQESDKGDKTQFEGQGEEETVIGNDVSNLLVDSGEAQSKTAVQGSPVKQRELEAIVGPDIGNSPSSCRTRGTWSPSASPSTSILKKGQKRTLEDETPSPLLKSRRVSFANPIQHQETADDIDRRSPAIRTSSPRRSKISSIPQPKYVTTPTKGLLVLSPRNLHSPGYKSSKKCLISEMSQEPWPVSKDCIYPALVGCSTPVEAVLPQISSNMWSRGFGQLVRARNIKTVGDLSSLTPSEIKTLPIRSPKISNVKKALKIYEQRKGRAGDELKSFDETEMTPDQSNFTQNQDEKTSVETLATELMDDPVPVDEKLEQDSSRDQMADPLTGEQGPEGQLHPEGLPLAVEALSCRFSPLELSSCSSLQLVQLHDQLGGMMRNIVVELQTRLCQTDGKP